MNIKQVCEVCYKEPANSITHDPKDDIWYFCCKQCLSEGYCIAFDRLSEQDWITHLDKKGWVNMNQLLPKLLWSKKCYDKK